LQQWEYRAADIRVSSWKSYIRKLDFLQNLHGGEVSGRDLLMSRCHQLRLVKLGRVAEKELPRRRGTVLTTGCNREADANRTSSSLHLVRFRNRVEKLTSFAVRSAMVFGKSNPAFWR
jgi:hypothetical protein